MRTTIDIAPHLLKRLRDEAHRRGLSLKEMLDRALQLGLRDRVPARATTYRCPTFALGSTVGADNLDRALAIASALEDEETVRELSRRK